ncbi:MAG: aminoacyl-histidine dipeptidase [Oscillospiraceae bacterium]
MSILKDLEPRSVFRFFEELCAIPHGSGNTKPVSDWLMAFARERGLEAWQDEMNNVVIVKEAAPGYEDAETVILQGHMDMVCEKAPDCAKDMDREGLDLAVEGDAVYARGTTLGGDDGIAVAMALAILDADDIPHPRLEAVFTVDEETGMLGAAAMDVSRLRGRRLLNLDSEEEGVFTVSCAGGNLTQCALPVRREAFSGARLTVTVGGLRGGHSGIEIHKGLGNANLLLGRVLTACAGETALRVVAVGGGMKDNAIPREASATVAAADARAVEAVCARLDEALKNEYRATDAEVFVSAAAAEEGELPMDEDSTRRVLCFLTCAPNGIQAMSAEIAGLVQTSLNLGVLTTARDSVTASFCVRSSVDSQKQMLVERLRSLTETLGGTVAVFGDYAGWEYRPDSPLRELLTEVFTEQYGHAPRIEAIHAGVECGIFAGKLPGLDCISLGPDLAEVHTCRERLYISSLQRLWAMVLETLKRMK